MKVTERTKRVLICRRQARELLAGGYEEINERGGDLWKLHRGGKTDHVIVDVVIAAHGKTVFIKTERRASNAAD